VSRCLAAPETRVWLAQTKGFPEPIAADLAAQNLDPCVASVLAKWRFAYRTMALAGLDLALSQLCVGGPIQLLVWLGSLADRLLRYIRAAARIVLDLWACVRFRGVCLVERGANTGFC